MALPEQIYYYSEQKKLIKASYIMNLNILYIIM